MSQLESESEAHKDTGFSRPYVVPTNGRAYATVLRLFVVCRRLSLTLCRLMAKRCMRRRARASCY